ncbi:MAG: hypothetical protein ACYC40_03440 [Patescibacteria group bacterium]
MPRTKAVIAKKKTTKKIISKPIKKKSKKVIVDIIEDEDSVSLVSEKNKESARKKEEEAYNRLVTEKYEDDSNSMPIDGKPISEEIDSQKKFFSKLIEETKEKKTGNNSSKKINEISEAQPAKHVGLYRKLVWKFLLATAVLLGIVFYFSFSKLVIEITPKGEALNDTLFLKVSQNNSDSIGSENNSDPRTPITGEIKKVNLSLEQDYPASGEELGVEELNGRVVIINNSPKNQALVATTRLLSPENKLFRIKNAVNVPAGGEISVDIYADKPSQEMAIGPTTFTIPGLWAGLQDKIFARSDQEFTYARKVKKFIKQIDIENAAKDINERLMSNAASSSDQTGNWLYSVSDEVKVVYSAKAGDIKDNFSAKAQGDIIGISFPKEMAAKLVGAKLKLLIPDDKELIEFKPENIVYTLDAYDSVSNTATVKASFSGTMALKADATVVNREQLVNLTKAQIDNYLKDFPGIMSYKLSFFPSFIQRAPNLVDRISIIIKKDK